MYDMLGGMAAVVISDVIQMAILYLESPSVGSASGCWRRFRGLHQLRILGSIVGTESLVGLQAVDFSGTGLTADTQYGFWPMLLGGLFLYVSYYGTDQTQVQREFSSKDIDDTNRSLMLNGMRFPLVATYCFPGVCIGAYIVKNPDFLLLLNDGGSPNYNLPQLKFVTSVLPHGVIGLVMVALFSAAMSSLDSTINSSQRRPSRTSMSPSSRKGRSRRQAAQPVSILHGLLGHTHRDLLVLRGRHLQLGDRVGEQGGPLANGPILAMFLLGILTRFANEKGAISGLVAGLIGNALVGFAPEVSWPGGMYRVLCGLRRRRARVALDGRKHQGSDRLGLALRCREGVQL